MDRGKYKVSITRKKAIIFGEEEEKKRAKNYLYVKRRNA
jgi:hypothetical protein